LAFPLAVRSERDPDTKDFLDTGDLSGWLGVLGRSVVTGDRAGLVERLAKLVPGDWFQLMLSVVPM
jgi:hypothetical protein